MENRFSCLGVALWAAALLVGCADFSGSDGEPLDDLSEPIINGWTDFGTRQLERWATVGLTTPRFLHACSGTLLRNNVVLTARHCVTTDGTMSGPVATDLSHMRARVQGVPPPGSCGNLSSAECRSVASIHALPFNPNDATHSDAALVVLSGPLTVNGDAQNFFNVLDPYTAASHIGFGTLIAGYGTDENGNSGVLKAGRQIINAAGDAYATLADPYAFHGFEGFDYTEGSTPGGGDSGGGMWQRANRRQTAVVGVTSSGHEEAFDSAHFAQAADFRYDFNTYLQTFTRNFNITSFASSSLTNFEQVKGATNTNANWQVSNGAIVQKNNTARPLLIWNKDIYENGVVFATISSTDSSALGVIVRYVDPNNYVWCQANSASDELVMMKRVEGEDVFIGSTPWSGTFTAQKEMVVYFSAKYMSCDFDGLQIVGTQNTFVAGRIGMYNHYNDEGKLHRFRAVKEPSTSTSW